MQFMGRTSRYDRYPRSAGVMLRHLGKLVDEASEPATRHVEDILRLKHDLFGPAPLPEKI